MTNLAPDARILIVRLSAIGDVLHGMPVLNALRVALPEAFLAWVVEGRAAQLLRGHKALDELVEVPRGWLKSPRAVLELRRRLRGLGFDVAIDLQGLSKSAIAARLSAAPRRIGFDGVDGREISRWLNNERVAATRTHVVDRNLELLGRLGISHPAVCFDLVDATPTSAAVDKMLLALLPGENFAVINPGAGWPSKLWPAERYGAVARHLGQARGLRSMVVWAGDQERAWAEEIVAGSRGCAALAPSTSLAELAALVRRAVLFVGSDTGPLHLAAAVGTPCVAMFGPSPGERNGPYGTAHVTLQKVRLTGSSKERRTANGDAMAAISIDDVCAACEEILDRLALGRTG
jgi:heptosyltransferase I